MSTAEELLKYLQDHPDVLEEHGELLNIMYGHSKEREEDAKFHHYEELAFIIERFCGGKIEFPAEDLCEAFECIDIQRSCIDGVITYVTRRTPK
jgi:hypothetical protein